jgi:hypothetical protein
LVLEAKPDLASSYVLYGLGGVGKTQIAIEYLYQHRADFDIIYWLQADSYESLLASYRELSDEPSFKAFMSLDLSDETNPEIIAARIKNWFENSQGIKWLIIIDGTNNIDSVISQDQGQEPKVKTIATLIPKGRGGCVLVTSRDRSANGQLASRGEELLCGWFGILCGQGNGEFGFFLS